MIKIANNLVHMMEKKSIGRKKYKGKSEASLLKD